MFKYLTVAAVAASALFAGQAFAAEVNVSAYNVAYANYGTPATLNLAAGTYQITYGYTGGAQQFQGWDLAASNFGLSNQAPAVAGCDSAGANCSAGWLDSFGYTINGAANSAGSFVYYGPAGTTRTTGSGQAFSTAAAALAAYSAALPYTAFTLATASAVTFFVPDSGFNVDNYGGVTLAVTSVPATAVPEPASLALLGAGLVGMCFLRRRSGASA